MSRISCRIRKSIEPRRNAECTEPSVSTRDLFNRAATCRGSKQMRAAANAGTEIDETPIRAPLSIARQQIPAGSQVLHLPTVCRNRVHINWPAVILFSCNHGTQALLAAEDDEPSIGRERRRAVIEAVIGQAFGLTFSSHDPQVRSLICILVALMSVCFDNQRTAVGAPGRR